MEKSHFKTAVQIFTLVLVIINAVYIIPLLVMFAAEFFGGSVPSVEPIAAYFISVLIYIGLRIMYFCIVTDVLFISLYISQFVINKKRGIFIFSMAAAGVNILLNVICVLCIPMVSSMIHSS